jgi:outer membrane biogenesis lipoprotein LolB
MKITMMLAVTLLLISCGKRREKECRNRESMEMQCQVENIPNYGRQYAQRVCSEQYSVEKCY